MIKDFDFKKLEDIEIDGINPKDYPDFCDAFIESASYEGRKLTEEELIWIEDNYPDECYEVISGNAIEGMVDHADYINDMLNER